MKLKNKCAIITGANQGLGFEIAKQFLKEGAKVALCARDIKKLNEAQLNNDVVAAQEILQGTFRTDVRSVVAEARLRAGAALDPVAFFRNEKIRGQLIKQRGTSTIATGL